MWNPNTRSCCPDSHMARPRAVSTVDLHIHTTCSDGSLAPAEVVQECVTSGMQVVALADHDITDGIPMAAPLAEAAGIHLVPAVEINTEFEGSEVHVLGYWIALDSPALQEHLRRIREARLERNRRIIARLAEVGCHISEERVREIAGEGSVGRPHLAAALVEAGCAESVPDAFDRYLGRRGVAYVARYRITPEEAIAQVRQAGGLPVLAHPGNLGRDHLITDLLAAGLRGVEAYHSDHTSDQAAHYVAMAKRLGLLVTGGTDTHGNYAAGGSAIGSVPVPEWVGEGILAARPR